MAADTQALQQPSDEETVIRPGKPAKKSAADLPDEAIQTLKRTSDSVQHIAGEGLAAYTDTLATLMQTGSQTSKLIMAMNKSYMDACSAVMINMAEIARECMTCRTPADVVDLQKKAMETMTDTVTSTGKLYSDTFTAFSSAVEPLVARTSDVPERMFRALAD
jgi:hypothetical protein